MPETYDRLEIAQPAPVDTKSLQSAFLEAVGIMAAQRHLRRSVAAKILQIG